MPIQQLVVIPLSATRSSPPSSPIRRPMPIAPGVLLPHQIIVIKRRRRSPPETIAFTMSEPARSRRFRYHARVNQVANVVAIALAYVFPSTSERPVLAD
jgi:hypothetical protein